MATLATLVGKDDGRIAAAGGLAFRVPHEYSRVYEEDYRQGYIEGLAEVLEEAGYKGDDLTDTLNKWLFAKRTKMLRARAAKRVLAAQPVVSVTEVPAADGSPAFAYYRTEAIEVREAASHIRTQDRITAISRRAINAIWRHAGEDVTVEISAITDPDTGVTQVYAWSIVVSGARDDG